MREHRGSESEEGGSGEEGWGEKERGRKLFIPVGDNNDLIHCLLCCLSDGIKSHMKIVEQAKVRKYCRFE